MWTVKGETVNDIANYKTLEMYSSNILIVE